MLSDVREYYGLLRELQGMAQHSTFDTAPLQRIAKELKLAIKDGKLIALSGIVGTGKSTIIARLKDLLIQEKEILVAESLTADGSQTTISSLITALFCDLSPEKDFKIPPPERRERVLRELIKKRHKPVALLIDDAHSLNGNTLISLKRLTEVVRQGKGTLSIVLIGHPKLKNDLLRGAMEEVGARTAIFELEGFGPDKAQYLDWLLLQALGPKVKTETVLTDEAVALLRERLATPLQFENYLTRAFEEAFKVAQKPIGADMIEAVLAKDLDELEARLMRQGYTTKVVAEILDIKPKEVRAFMKGHLPPERTQELHHGLLAAGVPL